MKKPIYFPIFFFLVQFFFFLQFINVYNKHQMLLLFTLVNTGNIIIME